MESSVERAALLLRAAAEFFRSLGKDDDPIRDQMERNARAYEQVARELEHRRPAANPRGDPERSALGAPAPAPEVAAVPAATPGPSPAADPAAPGHGAAPSEGTKSPPPNAPPVILPRADVPPRRRYLVQCWRAGASRRDPPEFEFLIADASSGADAVQQGRHRAEELARKMGHEERFVCRAQRC